MIRDLALVRVTLCFCEGFWKKFKLDYLGIIVLIGALIKLLYIKGLHNKRRDFIIQFTLYVAHAS